MADGSTDDYGYQRRRGRTLNTGLGVSGVRVEEDDKPGDEYDLTPEQSKAVVEAKFAKIRASFIDEYGFMPAWIGPDGTPHRKGETT